MLLCSPLPPPSPPQQFRSLFLYYQHGITTATRQSFTPRKHKTCRRCSLYRAQIKYAPSNGRLVVWIGKISVGYWVRIVLKKRLLQIAGMVGKVIEYPFDTVKVRLQTQPLDRPYFNGPLHCLTVTLKQEGIRGLFKV